LAPAAASVAIEGSGKQSEESAAAAAAVAAASAAAAAAAQEALVQQHLLQQLQQYQRQLALAGGCDPAARADGGLDYSAQQGVGQLGVTTIPAGVVGTFFPVVRPSATSLVLPLSPDTHAHLRGTLFLSASLAK
jgi:hypothetical protein